MVKDGDGDISKKPTAWFRVVNLGIQGINFTQVSDLIELNRSFQ